jgi:hypothetical protein
MNENQLKAAEIYQGEPEGAKAKIDSGVRIPLSPPPKTPTNPQFSSQNVTERNFSTRKCHIERIAFERGFRVSECGTRVTKPNGNPQPIRLNRQGYFVFTVHIGSESRPCTVHRLQAYQKYGDEIYTEGLQVRHLDGNSKNNSNANILIGTSSQNHMDKPAHVRSRVAGDANRKYDAQAVRAFYAKTGSYKLTMLEFGITSKGTLHYILLPQGDSSIRHPLPFLSTPCGAFSA